MGLNIVDLQSLYFVFPEMRRASPTPRSRSKILNTRTISRHGSENSLILAKWVVFVICGAMVLGAISPFAAAANDETDRPLRIAVARFHHEATTFSPEKAGIGDFEPASVKGEDLLEFGEDMYGFVKFAREHTNVEIMEE